MYTHFTLVVQIALSVVGAGHEATEAQVAQSAAELPLTLGTPVSGTLQAGDQQLTSGEYTDEYHLTVEAGVPLVVRLTSTQFDTYIIFIGPDGRQLDVDDTPGQGTNSVLETTTTVAGQYRVLATTYAPGMTGQYTLVAQTGAATAAPVVPALTPGQSVEGALAPTEGAVTTATAVDQYVFEGRRGEQIELRASASGVQPVLILHGPGGFAQETTTPGEATALTATLPEDGTYAVSVTTAEPGQSGDYALALTSAGAAAAPASPVLLPGQPVSDALNATDLRRGTGQHFRTYTFQGEAGQTAVIELSSTAFDTYLIVKMPNEGQESNDDIDYQGGNTNSRLSFVLPVSGTYEVLATSYAAGQTGPFTVQLVSLGARAPVDAAVAPIPPATPGGLTLGTPVQGALQAGDETLASGEYVDTYVVQGRARQGITVSLTSTQFDTYVIVRGPDGFQLDNDDGPNIGTNSQAELTLPADGAYEVLVTSYRPGEVGAYELRVREGTSALTAGRGRVFAVMAGITDYVEYNDLEYCAEDATKLH